MGGNVTRFIAAILAIITLAAGCSVQGPGYEQVSPSPQKGVVYLYRTPDLFGFTRGTVDCGDHSVALGSGGYSSMVLDRQALTCSVVTNGNSSVEFLVQPGQVYYVRERSFWGFLGPRFYVEIPDTGDGPEQIRECKLS